MSISKRFVSVFLSILMLLSAAVVFSAPKADAASKKAKAIAAYKSLLASNSLLKKFRTDSLSELKFATVYLDNNKVPELVVWQGSDAYLYTYKSKVKKVAYLKFGSLSEKFQYYKKTGMFIDCGLHSGVIHEGYNKFKGTKATLKLFRTSRLSMTATSYTNFKVKKSKNVKISAKKFKKELKKLTKKKKKKSAKFYFNTEDNVKKYLK